MKAFDNLTLSKKFGLSFGIVLGLLCLLGAAGLSGFGKVAREITTFEADVVPGQAEAAKIEDSMMVMDITLNEAASPHYPEGRAKSIAEFKKRKADVPNVLKAYEKTVSLGEEREHYDQFLAKWNAYDESTTAFVKDIEANADNAALGVAYRKTVADFEEVDAIVRKIVDWNSAHGYQVVKESQELVAKTRSEILVTIGFALLIGSLFAIKLTRSITKPVLEVASRMKSLASNCIPSFAEGTTAMAQGDLRRRVKTITEPIAGSGKDEIWQMAASFNDMLGKVQEAAGSFNSACDNLCGLVGEVGEGSHRVSTNAEHVAIASSQISAGASQIAAGSESLAASATEAASIVEELQAQVNEVSESSDQQASAVVAASGSLNEAAIGIQKVDEAAKQMTLSATEGRKAVQETVEAMQTLKAQIALSNEKVIRLDDASKHIGDIVNTIDNIAGQTNLLALNAAIEAARAGAHGRGFAVVADEVRKLAEQSSHATKEITALIHTIREVIQETVESISTTAENADDGVQKSSLAGEVLQEIFAVAEQVASHAQEVESVTLEATKAMRNVAEAAEYNQNSAMEMQIGTQKVSRAITDVAAVSEESAACAEELSASIQSVSESVGQLNGLAGTLKSQVLQFNIGDESEPTNIRLAA